MMVDLKFETAELILRPFNISDAKDVSDYSTQPIVAHWLSDMVLSNEDDAIEWINWINKENSVESKFIVLAIELKGESKVIGVVGIHPKDTIDNEIEIFYGISDKYQRNGYCSESSKRLIEWAFENASINKLVAIVKPENVASEKVIKNLEFQYKDTRMLPYDGDVCKFKYYVKEKN